MRRPHAAKPSRQEAIQVEGLTAPVEVRRHPAARRMTLRVSRTRRAVIVTLPMSCDLQQAGRFLTTHIDWVRERLGSVPEPRPFAHGGWVPLRGELHAIEFRGPQRGHVVERLPVADDCPPRLVVRGHREHAPRRLSAWLAAEARRDLVARVAHHARNLGLTHGRVTLRDQTSRWGSCSSNGNLSFSWRLVMAPSLVLDYVAAHEVAHLKEMNHGPRFWALCRRAMPEMDDARKWLDLYGVELHRYGAAALREPVGDA